MIIIPQGGSLTLVRQTDHAAMSGQASRAWRPLSGFPQEIWSLFLEAVRTHDDGWRDADCRPALDAQGKMLDFKTVPASVHIPIWRRGLEAARNRHPYIALLVAHHGIRLYTQIPEKASAADAEASRGFIAELSRAAEDARQALLLDGDAARRAADPVSIEAAHRLLGFLDGLSLMLLGALPLSERTGPIRFGDEERCLTLRRDADRLTIDPWPFLEPRIELRTDARRIDRDRFSGAEDLAGALERAEPVMIRRVMAREN